MAEPPLITSISQITPKALREIEMWLEPWFRTKAMTKLSRTTNTNGYYKVTQKLTANASSVVFSGISQKFTTLRLEWAAAAVGDTEQQILLAKLNGISADASYYWHVVSPGGVGDQTDVTSGDYGSGTFYAALGFIPCDNEGEDFGNVFSTGGVNFRDYTDSLTAAIAWDGSGSSGQPNSDNPDAWVSAGNSTFPGPLTSIELFTIDANGGTFVPLSANEFKATSRFTLLAF